MQHPFSLHSLPKLCVSGGIVAGEVELNLQSLRDHEIGQVHVRLRGSIHTMVRGKHGAMNETIPLLYRSMSVWARGAAFLAPNARVPFKFNLPPNIPPSFDFMGLDTKAVVRYFIEVVGLRTGVFRLNKKCIFPLAVVPSDPSGAQLRSLLQLGWQGEWSTVRRESGVRRGIWGPPAKAILEFLIPSIDRFPLFTRIPFAIKVITFSKPMKRRCAAENRSIFPAPPLHPKDISLVLKHKVHVFAHQFDALCPAQKVAALGGMGGSTATVNMVGLEKVWIPLGENSDKGSWRQETYFSSTLLLQCPPTFCSYTLSTEYYLHVQVHFDGLFNTVEAEIPIKVGSGLLSAGDRAGRPRRPDCIDESCSERRSTSASPSRRRSLSAPPAASLQRSLPFSAVPSRRVPVAPPSPASSVIDPPSYIMLDPEPSPALDLPPSYWACAADDWEYRHRIPV